MEPPSLAYAASSSLRSLPESSSRQDPEEIDVDAMVADDLSQSKRKWTQVVPHGEIIDLDGEDDPTGVVIVGEKDNIDGKNKALACYAWKMPIKDSLVEDNGDSSTDMETVTASLDPPELFSYTGKFNPDKFIPESATNDDVFADDDNYEYDDNEELEFEDYEDGGGDDDYDYDANLYAQFDAVDLPPGVEASVPWLHMPTSPNQGANGSSTPSLPGTNKLRDVREDDVEKKFSEFKQFDTVSDFSDHHFAKGQPQTSTSTFRVSLTKKVNQAPKDWAKTIQQEWKILEKDLPETIFVRVYEERLDLLRAVIIGAAGTPYHDGLFFFDAYFPPTYPNEPPLVYYHSGGLRLNPNLYHCGKVCLSLLNTWSGSNCELWTPGKSTMLQVLVSIQALVLNEKPYFNEPGYAKSAGMPAGEKKSAAYSEEVFILSCKTMMYALRKPPKHFENFVAGHFRQRAHAILHACKAYMNGAPVGSLVGEVKDTEEGKKDEVKTNEDNSATCSTNFRTHLSQIFPRLLVSLADNGADCRQFVDKPDNVDTILTLRVHKFDT